MFPFEKFPINDVIVKKGLKTNEYIIFILSSHVRRDALHESLKINTLFVQFLLSLTFLLQIRFIKLKMISN